MKLLIGVLLLLFGGWTISRAQLFADRIQKFYSSYPVIHLAGGKQLKPRPGFVMAFGGVIVAFGLAAIVVSLLA